LLCLVLPVALPSTPPSAAFLPDPPLPLPPSGPRHYPRGPDFGSAEQLDTGRVRINLLPELVPTGGGHHRQPGSRDAIPPPGWIPRQPRPRLGQRHHPFRGSTYPRPRPQLGVLRHPIRGHALPVPASVASVPAPPPSRPPPSGLPRRPSRVHKRRPAGDFYGRNNRGGAVPHPHCSCHRPPRHIHPRGWLAEHTPAVHRGACRSVPRSVSTTNGMGLGL
jgi:hypothetical protein